ncbi:GGDEF domain-containing protein [Psychrosphaera sp. 1_MG-2023]|uniref:GGDEF domain-containing protein n=1 Tax=Psychrosphaera sp. 1_MG-2023 TaxID=3062643 RepID=UPI0026E2F9A1|nr:GGDEF domain-containing protein [Psychrosphaera sp. 1_MG-2023]MDO6720651.1 GGDEF domain-containing protein [Psychrosphaera sp. 1_MG-2023]
MTEEIRSTIKRNKDRDAESLKFDYTLLMSCQRSVVALNKTLVHILEEVVAPYEYKVYLSSDGTERDRFYLFSSSSGALENPQEIDQIRQFDLDELERVDELALIDENKIFYPAILNHRFYACIVTGIDVSEEVDEQIICIMAIYCNVLILITDSKVDGLTQLLNRKSFDIDLALELQRPDMEKRRSSDGVVEVLESHLAIIDIDFFKAINDEYGHVVGDEVLVELAELMRLSFRSRDGLFRYGGEEFAVILRDVSRQQTKRILNRFCNMIENHQFKSVDSLTISIGCCGINNELNLLHLVEYADKALYYSKENGRNRVTHFEDIE